MVLIFTDNRGGGGRRDMFLNKIFFSDEAQQRVKFGGVSYVSLK